MDWNHTTVDLEGLIADLRLPHVHCVLLMSTLSRIEGDEMRAHLYHRILFGDAHLLRSRRGPSRTPFGCQDGAAWRAALLARATLLLIGGSPGFHEIRTEMMVGGAVLGGLGIPPLDEELEGIPGYAKRFAIQYAVGGGSNLGDQTIRDIG